MQTSPPDNAAYMVAAYLIVALAVGGYAVSLLRRARKALGRNAGTPERRSAGG